MPSRRRARNLIRIGASMTEHEAERRLIEAIRQAEGSCRVLAHYRRDGRWIVVANLFLQILDKCTTMIAKGLLDADAR